MQHFSINTVRPFPTSSVTVQHLFDMITFQLIFSPVKHRVFLAYNLMDFYSIPVGEQKINKIFDIDFSYIKLLLRLL